jgi:hypothetical protein
MERGSRTYHSVVVAASENTIILSLTLKTSKAAIRDECKEKETLLRPPFTCLV